MALEETKKKLEEENSESIQQTAESVAEQVEISKDTNIVLGKISSSLAKLYDLSRRSYLDEKRKIDSPDQKSTPFESMFTPKEFEVKGIEGVIAGVVGGVVGFIAGFVTELGQVYKAITISLKEVPKAFKNIATAVKNVSKATIDIVKGLFRGIGEEGFLAEFLKTFSKEGLIAQELKLIGKTLLKPFTMLAEGVKTLATTVLKSFGIVEEITAGVRMTETGVMVRGEKIIRLTEGVRDFLFSMRKFFDGLMKPFRAIGRGFTTVTTSIAEFSVSVVEFTTEFGKGIGDAIRSFRTAIAESKTLAVIAESVGAVSARITSSFSRFAELFRAVGESSSKLFKSVSGGKGIFRTIMESLGTIGNAFRSVASILEPIGRIFARLFVPLVVIYETVTNFFKAFTDDANEQKSFGEKLLQGLFGTFQGIIEELLLVPLDLIKSFVSWIAGKFGADWIEESLDSFSFVEVFDKMFTAFKDGLDRFGTWLGGQIFDLFDDPVSYAKNLVSSVADGIMNLIKGISGFITDAIVGVLNLIPGVNIGGDESVNQLDAAKDAGVYKKSYIPFTKSDIDRDLVQSAPTPQLQAILADDDISKEDKKFIEMVIAAREPSAPPVNVEVGFQPSPTPAPVKVGSPTMVEVINPVPTEPMVLRSSENIVTAPSGNISGLGHESVSEGDTLRREAQSLEQTRVESVSNSNQASVIADNSSSNVSNKVTNYYQDVIEPTHDTTDQMFIYRATR